MKPKKTENWFEVSNSPKEFVSLHFKDSNHIITKIIAKSSNIRSLDMECFDLNKKALRLIAANCPKLVRINFDSANGFNDQFVYYLVRKFTQLRFLNLSCCSHISEKFIYRFLRSLPNLVALNICGTDITGECLSLLGPNLMSLNVSYC
jgi:hypothetical protein